MTKIDLGLVVCFAVKRWPEPESWCKIVGEDLGIRYAQFSFDLVDPRTIEPVRSTICNKTKEVAKKYDVKIQSTFTGLAAYSYNLLLHPDFGMRLDALKWYEEAIHMTSMLGADGTGGQIGSLSMQDIENSDRRTYLSQCLMDSLEYLSGLAKLEGEKFILWEPMPVPREGPCTISDAKELYEKVNERTKVPILYCIDVGHQCCYTMRERDADPYAWLEELADKSPVIHIQQTDGKFDRHWPFTKKFNEVGIIKPPKVVDAIEKSGAKEVILMLEVIHPFETKESQVIEDLKESVDYWKAHLDG